MVIRRPAPAAKASPRSARTAAAKKTAAPAPSRRTAAPARKASPARPAAQSKGEQLAAARAAKAAKEAAAAETATKNVEPHPSKKDAVTANDVLRSFHTFNVLYAQWLQQQGDEMTEVLDFVAPILGAQRGAVKKSPLTRAKVEPEERVIDEYYNRDDIETYSIKELRELAADLVANGVPGMTETKVKSKILAEMEAAGLFREDGSADADEDDIEEDDDEDFAEDEDEDDESDDDDDDDGTTEENFTRAELKAMDLAELQDLAELNEKKWKGLDKAEIIDTLLGGSEEEDEDEEEEEEEDLEIDPDELPNMSVPELLDLCKQIGLKVPAASRNNQKKVIAIITDFLDNLPE